MKKNKKKLRDINIKNVKFLVTGGSGSLGKGIIKNLLNLGAKNIVSISRNESLIVQASNEIDSPDVKFKFGDITDKESLDSALNGIDIVFHTAAIKHVFLSERNPRETYRINILGLHNLLESEHPISRLINISSDKAIAPSNCYGATKLLGEYLVNESNEINKNETKYINIRCPNFIGSRGSVLDMWKLQLRQKNEIIVTDPEMTRYFITIDDASEFIVKTGLSEKINTDKIYYPVDKIKKFKLSDLAQAFLEINGLSNQSIKIVGAWPGEKKHESYVKDVPLMSVEELKSLIKKEQIF